MPPAVQVYAVEGEFGRADEGAEVYGTDAAFPALGEKGLGKLGVGGAHIVHVHRAVAPRLVHIRRYLHGYAHGGAESGGSGLFAHGEDVRQRNGRAYAHEEVIQPAHDEDLVLRCRSLRGKAGLPAFEHLAAGRAVHSVVQEAVPGEARSEGAPAFFAGDAVAVGEAVAKAEYVHRRPGSPIPGGAGAWACPWGRTSRRRKA